MKFPLLFISAVIMAFACSSSPKAGDHSSAEAQPDSVQVRQLYNMKCALCHGEDGKLGYAGSKDLSLSTMSRDEIIAIITFGKTTMPPQQNILTTEQIESLSDFTIRLRNN